jgi:hypothetical protein
MRTAYKNAFAEPALGAESDDKICYSGATPESFYRGSTIGI